MHRTIPVRYPKLRCRTILVHPHFLTVQGGLEFYLLWTTKGIACENYRVKSRRIASREWINRALMWWNHHFSLQLHTYQEFGHSVDPWQQSHVTKRFCNHTTRRLKHVFYRSGVRTNICCSLIEQALQVDMEWLNLYTCYSSSRFHLPTWRSSSCSIQTQREL